MQSEHMEDREFRAGRRVLFFCAANLVVWPLFILVMSLVRGWSYMLFLPVALVFIYAYLLISASKKPIARISDNTLILHKMKKMVTLDKINAFKLIGKYNAEIILDDQTHLSVPLHEFSRDDRDFLVMLLQEIAEMNTKNSDGNSSLLKRTVSK